MVVSAKNLRPENVRIREVLAQNLRQSVFSNHTSYSAEGMKIEKFKATHVSQPRPFVGSKVASRERSRRIKDRHPSSRSYHTLDHPTNQILFGLLRQHLDACGMCGIFFSIGANTYRKPDLETIERLKARGPDSCQEHTVRLSRTATGLSKESHSGYRYLTFVSTVLALRGSQVRAQPLTDPETHSVLCWNGEAWKVDDRDLSDNDTHHVFKLLLGTLPLLHSSTMEPTFCDDMLTAAYAQLLLTLSRISGPYSFVFYDPVSSQIIYGRDCLGRRSLLTTTDGEDFVISSVGDSGPSTTWKEVETTGIYIVDLNTEHIRPVCLEWKSTAHVRRPDSLVRRTFLCRPTLSGH